MNEKKAADINSGTFARRDFVRIAGISLAGVAVGGTSLLGACDLFTGNDDKKGEDSPFTLMTNPTDPLLLRATTAGGTVEYFGSRDSRGVPTRVEHVTVDVGGEAHRFALGANSLPYHIDTPSGVQFYLEWTGPREAVVTTVSANGEYQVTTRVDFASPPSTQSIVNPAQVTPRALRSGKRVRLSVAGLPDAPPLQTNPTGNTVAVRVLRCGAVDNGTVMVDVVVRGPDGRFLLSVPAVRGADNLFRATIPGNIAPTYNLQENCLDLEDIFSLPCDVLEGLGEGAAVFICNAIAVAIDAATFPSGEAALLMAGCHRMVPAMEAYCATLGASPQPGSPSLGQMLCEAAFEDRDIPRDISLTAQVRALPQSVSSSTVTVSAGGPFPLLTVDMGGQPAIRDLTLSPSNPGRGVDYVARAQIYCIPAGSTVTMSIIGTDGYRDEVSYAVAQTNVNASYDLNVPGADSGVQDQVTLRVALPDGRILTRTASLVFGA
jgi:hypothetical protein